MVLVALHTSLVRMGFRIVTGWGLKLGGFVILFVGDTHGEFQIFDYIRNNNIVAPDDTIIQVGDFGFWPKFSKKWKSPGCRVLAIDGNHESFPMLQHETVEEMAQDLFYVPRGTILTIEGTTMGFMGGGESIDKAYRAKNFDWFAEERVSDSDIEKLIKASHDVSLDLLVTHTPPRCVISAALPPVNKKEWHLPPDWKDVSSINIEYLWNMLNNIPMICGHIHKSVVYNKCRVLDINEVYTYSGTVAEQSDAAIV